MKTTTNIVVVAPTSLVQRIPRAKLLVFEEEVKKLPQEHVELKHMFAQGVYAREGFLKAGLVFTGKIHTQSQINILSRGHVTVVTEEGKEEYIAPASWVSPAGVKRLCYVHEDSVWTTILGTNETDISTIENTLVLDKYKEE